MDTRIKRSGMAEGWMAVGMGRRVLGEVGVKDIRLVRVGLLVGGRVLEGRMVVGLVEGGGRGLLERVK